MLNTQNKIYQNFKWNEMQRTNEFCLSNRHKSEIAICVWGFENINRIAKSAMGLDKLNESSSFSQSQTNALDWMNYLPSDDSTVINGFFSFTYISKMGLTSERNWLKVTLIAQPIHNNATTQMTPISMSIFLKHHDSWA